ncbi:MAG TPA: DUF1828 domain-containing protein [Terriglobales bacterium]|nr:DUF1828 domain-containing protein [Terriglobales bacterium]
MNAAAIERAFQEKVGAKVRLLREGSERYRVLTPFLLEDGDHLAIVLKRNQHGWLLSDEGHTYMHLTYELEEKDLQSGTRQKIVTNALSSFHVEDCDGELTAHVEGEQFGDALYSFVQGLLRITDVTYLNRERVRSTFWEDFRALIAEAVPEPRRQFKWHDPLRDPQANYGVDCRVNGMARPLMVFALANDARARDATITLLQFEKWGLPHQSLGVFEDQEQVNRKVLARFSDVVEKQFASLAGNRERITNHLRTVVGAE